MISNYFSLADASAAIVRRGQARDIAAILDIEQSTPTAAHWSRADYGRYCLAVEENGAVQTRALFIACVRPDAQLTWKNVIGFAAFSAVTTATECELANIAVAEKWSGQGVGRRLLTAGLLWCRASCHAAIPVNNAMPDSADADGSCPAPHPTLWLEVRASNRSAIHFYQSAGFAVAGSRPAYYAQPVEDAILMRKILDLR